MNGFNGRGVLDGLPNGGTSLHSQVDFIKNSLEWITKEMSKFREEDENLKSQFGKLEGAVLEMRTLMETKRLSVYESDSSIGYPASGAPSESNLGTPVVQQYTESPRLRRRSKASAPLVATIPETPPQLAAPLMEEPAETPPPERPSQPVHERPLPPRKLPSPPARELPLQPAPEQPSQPAPERPLQSVTQRPSQPRVPRRLPPPPPPRRATVPAQLGATPDLQTTPPKPKSEAGPVQQRLSNSTAGHAPSLPESNPAVANGSKRDKPSGPMGRESLGVSLDTSIGLSEGDLASDIFAALASKGLDL